MSPNELSKEFVDDFWASKEPAASTSAIEPVRTTGHTLPVVAYVQLLKIHNGGAPKRMYFSPAIGGPSLDIESFLGVGGGDGLELFEKELIEECDLPGGTILFGTDACGHGFCLLDYRAEEEPKVLHVDNKYNPGGTLVADSIYDFLQRLCKEPRE